MGHISFRRLIASNTSVLKSSKNKKSTYQYIGKNKCPCPQASQENVTRGETILRDFKAANVLTKADMMGCDLVHLQITKLPRFLRLDNILGIRPSFMALKG
ncbi:hypothetical protein PAEPH01_1949 [Pancytospora epiphaga]|nr:hypothetical protein PAEPH01_1949 [Pancytospora epiphaga]